ncbi:MAG: rod shape-determining protein MreC [Oscillospiraceae bacterium]|nr:rod shape-determining protein MreC [Oscillospiraceae bacterium]
MKEYIKKYGIRLLALVVLITMVFALATGLGNGQANGAEDTAGAVRSPFQKVAQALVSRVEGFYGYLFNYDMLTQENENLRAQIAELEKQVRENEQAKEENVKLRELLNLSQKHSDFVFESAKVVSWNASNWASTFTISKGAEAGLEVGDAVVTEYGVLVGTVSEVGTNWSTVDTVVDIGTKIGVLVGTEETSAMLLGDYTLMSSQYMKISFVAESGQVITGDIVVTSGAGGAYPQGLILGTVSSVHSEAAGQIEYAVVEPFTDLNALTQIFVIKDYQVIE